MSVCLSVCVCVRARWWTSVFECLGWLRLPPSRTRQTIFQHHFTITNAKPVALKFPCVIFYLPQSKKNLVSLYTQPTMFIALENRIKAESRFFRSDIGARYSRLASSDADGGASIGLRRATPRAVRARRVQVASQKGM